jgi:hypothetical protein
MPTSCISGDVSFRSRDNKLNNGNGRCHEPQPSRGPQRTLGSSPFPPLPPHAPESMKVLLLNTREAPLVTFQFAVIICLFARFFLWQNCHAGIRRDQSSLLPRPRKLPLQKRTASGIPQTITGRSGITLSLQQPGCRSCCAGE